MNISILILTCDKNSDLSFIIKDNCDWQNVTSVISTETDYAYFKDCQADCVLSGKSSFSERFADGLAKIKTDYVLVLLDDYYITDKRFLEKMSKWNRQLEHNKLDVLKVCSDGKLYKKLSKKVDGVRFFRNIHVYEIDFHPTIWRKDHLIKLLENKKLSPWEIEPLFYAYILNNELRCAISETKIEYRELVVQGQFFRSPYKKYVKSRYHGSKKPLTLGAQTLFNLKRLIYHLLPRGIIARFRRLRKKHSFSADVEQRK